MSTYSVTFRISDAPVGGRTYQQRYDGLMDRLRELGLGYWTEPTSFALIESNEDTISFAQRIVRGLSAQHDMLFTFDPSDMSACYFGPLASEDVLRSFFPKTIIIG